MRLLKPTGEVAVVTTFPMTPVQHETWFAVSPDGGHLLAGVLTLPAVGDKVPGAEWRTLVGTWKFDLESAVAGGQAKVLKHVESATAPDEQNADWKTVFPVGWTQAGPVAMVGAPLATQAEWHGGPLDLIDEAGQPGQRIGGDDATAAHILPDGTLATVDTGGQVAVSTGVLTVRDASGNVLWRPAVDGHGLDTQLSLSPDGDAVAMDVHAATRGGPFALPADFHVHGFIDSRTAVGRQWLGAGYGNLSYVQLGDAAHPHDLGLMGRFVGVWSAAS